MREESVFLKAIELEPGEQRDAYLNEACAGNACLRDGVEQLLAAHQDCDSIFDRTATFGSKVDIESGPANSQLGDFQIISELGRGGMGIVYRAIQKSLNRPVALKVLPQRLGLSQRTIVRFRREAEAAARLHHTNIVPVYSIGESEGVHFYAMEVIDGPSLDNVLQAIRGGDFLETSAEIPDWVVDVIGMSGDSESFAGSIGSQTSNSSTTAREMYFYRVAEMFAGVSHALQHAHEHGVTHRDIKPANLLLSSDGRLSISDFGLARMFDQASLTISGEFVGTPKYMSPEQITSGRAPLDHRTDIYSLGATLYELLVFEAPFSADSRDKVIAQILHKDPRRLRRLNPRIPKDLETICLKSLEKDPEKRYASAGDLARDLERFVNGYSIRGKRPGVLDRTWKFAKRNRTLSVSLATVTLAVFLSGFMVVQFWEMQRRNAAAEYARKVVLPEIRNDISRGDYVNAFVKAEEVEKIIPDDPELSRVWRIVAVNMSVQSDPPGAEVVLTQPGARYSSKRKLGVTPLENVRLPRGCFVWKFSRSGYEISNVLDNTESEKTVSCKLVQSDSALPEMVRVDGGKAPVSESFFIDREEVSNFQFHRFVAEGGYNNASFWEALINDHGEENWRSIIQTQFIDGSSQLGPAGWKNGTYPVGEEDMPVRGVSWYEAAAFAKFSGKSLPTIHHWRQAAGKFKNAFATVPFSNIGGNKAGPVDYVAGISRYGAYHMAGNVREWCWNASDSQSRYQLGGSWSDPTYLYSNAEAANALSRSPHTGFRCMWHESGVQVESRAFADEPQLSFRTPIITPVEDAVFESWRSFWQYSRDGLKVTPVDEIENANWTERILEYGQPRSEGRMRAHLFIPHGFEGPYQTIVFFPGGSANKYEAEFGVRKSSLNWIRIDYLLRSGRAVCCPILSGTYERMGEMVRRRDDPHGHVDWSNRVLREISRTIDLLETQPDIDHQRIAYVGTSWGGSIGPRILAVEPRLKAGVLALGGLYHDDGLQQTNDVHFLPRVKVPVLMLNGRYDIKNPIEELEYVLENLGTEDANKQLKLFETGHAVPVEQLLEWTEDWFDKHLGSSKPAEAAH